MPNAPDPAIAALNATLRADRGRIFAALMARLRDFQRAEDALQDAAASALVHWGRAGVPDNPAAWLIRVAFRKAIDGLRQQKRTDANLVAMALLARDEAAEEPEMIADERLRLVFTCCHPALEQKTRVALTLRSIAGLTTAEIASAFLDTEPAMAQRLSRAKAKIAAAGIPFSVPDPEVWDERLNSVLTVCYLIYNSGYSIGAIAGRDLCEESIFLARLLNQMRPGEPEVEGLLALVLLTHARRAARSDVSGMTVPLADQDRSLWDDAMIAEGRHWLNTALHRRKSGPFQTKAAIAALHVEPGPTDWPQVLALYDVLLRFEATPVVELNRAVAWAEAGAISAALDKVAQLEIALEAYQPFHAARADLLARTGRFSESRAAYDRAIELARSASDAQFLTRRRNALPT
jgi:RNA polymerase sigma factor (sigma-70 family)